MSNRNWAGSMVVCLVAAGSLGACGADFASDCRASRTCSETSGGDAPVGQTAGGDASAENGAGASAENGGEPSAENGGKGSAGAPSDSSSGGAKQPAEPTAGAGGTDAAGCKAPEDCSNDDPADGEETCDAHGVCQPGNAPPSVVSVSPDDEAKDADPGAAVVITFSEPLAASTVTSENVKLFDGDTEIAGKLEYSKGTITFTPAVPLFMLEAYKVSVSTAVTDADGAPLLSTFSSTFTTRDGAWKTIDAVTGSLTGLADALPISATGNVLLAWNGTGGGNCPASARWFRLAAQNGAAQAFDATDSDCSNVIAAASASGVGAVLWKVPNGSAGELAQQFRKGVWQAQNAVVTNDYSVTWPRVAVSPTGVVTFSALTAKAGFVAWHTDTAGNWSAPADTLSTDIAASPASIAFDASGSGIAVWAARTTAGLSETLWSRFAVAGGKWSAAKPIPNSSAKFASSEGAPAIAVTPDGDAMAVWVENTGDGNQIEASFFSHLSGNWDADSPGVATPEILPSPNEPPAIAFDGQTFVLASAGQWAAQGGECATGVCTYTSRYDVSSGKWSYPAAQQSFSGDVSQDRMPRLASDGRGGLLLVWPAIGGRLVYQRYLNGKWGLITTVPGGNIASNVQHTPYPFQLSMNQSGMAALAWGNYGSGGVLTTIRLASFF